MIIPRQRPRSRGDSPTWRPSARRSSPSPRPQGDRCGGAATAREAASLLGRLPSGRGTEAEARGEEESPQLRGSELAHEPAGLSGPSPQAHGRRQLRRRARLPQRRALSAGLPFFRARNGVILTPGLEGRVAPQYILGATDLRKHAWIADHRLCAQTSKACQPEGLQVTARLWDEAEPTAIEAFAWEAAARPVRLPVPAQTSPYVGVPCRQAS